MVKKSIYSQEFFEFYQPGARLSARAIVPLVMELVGPTSVIDVGCGTGEFLRAFQEHGVKEILGIDGEYVDRSLLAFPQENFQALDISQAFTLDKTYDLALCLEVAEHLAPERAADFISSLTRLATVILFSAAVPHQGGIHHVNEQWPDYWVQLFGERGFVPVDALRKRIWTNRQIDVWYRQNSLFFCNEQALARNNTLEREFKTTNLSMISIIHPEWYIHNTMTIPLLERLKMMAGSSEMARKIYRQTRKIYSRLLRMNVFCIL